MRILNSIRNDMKFQLKYGFYLLYLVLTIIYCVIILVIPIPKRGIVTAVAVFSDPAALGFFFMGAIVLFEKSERVLNSLFISPLKIDEYILAKVGSLSMISTLVGIFIVLLTLAQGINWFSFLLGLMLGSILFSLAGMIVATRINSLNQYLLGVIPLGLLLSLPSFLILLGFDYLILQFHPGVVILALILQGVGIGNISLLSVFILIGWIAIFWVWARANVRKMISSLGGVTL